MENNSEFQSTMGQFKAKEDLPTDLSSKQLTPVLGQNASQKQSEQKPYSNGTNQVQAINKETAFTKNLETAKNVILENSGQDSDFVKSLQKEIKDAALKSAELEKQRQELEQQNVKYAKELLETSQKLNVHQQSEDKWANREKRRKFHYDGVKSIMKFVGIDEPMNIILLYVFTIILLAPFLMSKFIKGTFGALIIGEEEGKKRSSEAKGFLWTIAILLSLLTFLICIVLAVNWLQPFGWTI